MYYSNAAKQLNISNKVYNLNKVKHRDKFLISPKEFLKVRYIFESIFVTLFFLSLIIIVPFKDSDSLLSIRKIFQMGLLGSLSCVMIKNYYFMKGSGVYTLLMLIPGVNILLFFFVYCTKKMQKNRVRIQRNKN
jgi:hypothetical protein